MRVFVGVVSKSSGVMVHGFLNLWTPSCFCTTLGIYQFFKCTSGSVPMRINFDKIDFLKWILAKIDFKLKLFMFGYIHVKVS
jgi:hypothetical protein